MNKPKRIVFLLIDGVSSSTLETLIDNGSLPNIALLTKEGSFFNNVVSSFPTVSGPAHVPLITGITPTSIDLIGHNQFIRKTGKLENYLLYYKQLDERLKDLPSLYKHYTNSVSVAEPVRANATAYRRNLFLLADWAKIAGPANAYVLYSVDREYRRGRDLIVAWLHETDGFAHRSKRKEYVSESLQRLDRWLGKFMLSMDKETTIVLTSDHGMEWTDGKPFSVPGALKQAGLSRGQYKYYLDGGAFCQLYIKKDGSFATRQNESHLGELPNKLAQHPEFDLVLYRRSTPNGMVAVIKNQKGTATVTKQNDRYRYSIEQGSDPLGYASLPPEMTAQECIVSTGHTAYPDGHFQIFELLNAPSSGDIILTGARGKSLNMLTKHAVHGGLHRSQSITFILSNARLGSTSNGTHDVPSCIRTSDLPRLLGVLD